MTAAMGGDSKGARREMYVRTGLEGTREPIDRPRDANPALRHSSNSSHAADNSVPIMALQPPDGPPPHRQRPGTTQGRPGPVCRPESLVLGVWRGCGVARLIETHQFAVPRSVGTRSRTGRDAGHRRRGRGGTQLTVPYTLLRCDGAGQGLSRLSLQHGVVA